MSENQVNSPVEAEEAVQDINILKKDRLDNSVMSQAFSSGFS